MSLDNVLQRAASARFDAYDPSAVIDAVNALVPLGKAGALAAVDSYLASKDPASQQGLFLVLRVAFDADPQPALKLGAPTPAAPASGVPRFPILMIGDVPVLLIASYTLRGLVEPVSAHVDYYRQHGTLRTQPLAPARATAADRMRDFETQYATACGSAPPPAVRELVKAQLERIASR